MTMVSSEAQRTLVKSPPELWAELSDPNSLARHLGELGEIRIVRVEAETKVEWEGDGLTGTIELKPSGWGTKVTLTATRQPPASPDPEAKPEPMIESEPELVIEPEPEPMIESMPQAIEPAPAAALEPIIEPEPVIEPEPRVGFFARIFRRRRKAQSEPGSQTQELEPASELESQAQAPQPKPASEPGPRAQAPQLEPASEPEPQAQAPGPGPGPAAEHEPGIEHEPIPEPAPAAEIEPEPLETQPDIAAELTAVEASMASETAAVLTSVLDRLGAAHHRPFSRA
jgi:hypothetical protein